MLEPSSSRVGPSVANQGDMKPFSTIAVIVSIAALAACSDPVSETEPGSVSATATEVDSCAKAKSCVDGLIESDPDRADTYRGLWRMVEAMTGDKKLDQCRQILEGAAYNPKAPADCT